MKMKNEESRIQAAIEKLSEVQKRCSQRTLSEDDIRYAVGLWKSMIAKYKALKAPSTPAIKVYHHGGYVCNSYDYPAYHTYISVSADGITVGRFRTSNRSYGRGCNTQVWVNFDQPIYVWYQQARKTGKLTYRKTKPVAACKQCNEWTYYL